MRKISAKTIGFILLVFTLPAISWVSIQRSQSQIEQVASTSAPETAAKTLSNSELFDGHVDSLYAHAGLKNSGLAADVFRKAVIGYYNMKTKGLVTPERAILSIIDFNQKSSKKRLWIVDLNAGKILYNTFVAHGRGSGDDMATQFSNLTNSHQSSLGFYVTNETYFGKHGLSMKLEGLDKNFNTNARNRAVVVHGADYVSQAFIDKHGRLGRSHGCPALPAELNESIINTIKGKTCLFINAASPDYSSALLDQELAVASFIAQSSVDSRI